MMTLAIALPFDFEQPAWLWLLLLVPIMACASLASLASLDPVRRVASLVCRSVLIILITCCLAGVEHVQRNDDLTVMFLMDRSHSVEGLLDQQEQFIKDATAEMPDDDRAGVIDFARNAFVQQLPMRGGVFLEPGRLPAMPSSDRTDVASALRLAMAMFPHDTAKRVVLMTDGNENLGDLLAEARRAKADQIPVDLVPLRYQRRNEVYFDRMIAPTHVERGEQVPLRMILHSDRHTTGTVTLYHNDELVEIPQEDARVELRPGNNTLFVKLPVETTDDQTYRAVFRPDDDAMDANTRNNTVRSFSFVAGPSRALLVSADPSFDEELHDALASEGVNVQITTQDQLGEFDLRRMSGYATIILSNIPAGTFTDQQHQMLATYVKDLGGGLIMLGGDEGFGAGGWIGSPVEEVMPVSFEIKHKRIIPRGALVLIMHSCEIPRGNFYGKEMAKKSVDTISSRDYLGILAYSFSPAGHNWEVPLDLATNKAAVKAKIDRMQIGDMPDFAATLRMALKELTTGRGQDAAQKHVIILSDGDASPPSAALLTDLVEAKITVSTVAIGWGAHVMQATMQRIAGRTGGKFYNARNPKTLPQIFVKESKVVRRPLIVDEPFSPQITFSRSELLAGINADTQGLPALGGMVLTSPKDSPNVQVPIVRVTDDGDDPVLAYWQIELGKAVAFTSGYWPVWGQRWTQWPKFAKFWSQLVRWTMRQEAPAEFDTYTKIEGNRGRIIVDALAKDASYLNFLQLDSKIIGPDNRSMPLRFTQTGPGHYEAEFEAEKAGQYLSSIHIRGRNRDWGTLRTGLSVPFSPEYRDLMPNEALLRQVVDTTGGRWLEQAGSANTVFSHRLPPTESKRPAWEWVLGWLILPLFLLDVAVRRLASWLALSIVVEAVVLATLLFGLRLAYGPTWSVLGALLLAELIGWTIRFRYIGPLFEMITYAVVALGQTGERSSEALKKLKGARDRMRGQAATGGGKTTDENESAEPPSPLVDPARRFDVGDERAGQKAGDLAQSLGGADATSTGEGQKQSQPSAKGEEGQAEDATSRLLRAKRRAKRGLDDKKDS
jgi:uncharacterized membrane protein